MDYEKAAHQVKKTRLLSGKSLTAVEDWAFADGNKENPLAVAYKGACLALASLDCAKIADTIKRTWCGREYGYIREAFKPYDLVFIYRDTIGRMILDMMRRERHNA